MKNNHLSEARHCDTECLAEFNHLTVSTSFRSHLLHILAPMSTSSTILNNLSRQLFIYGGVCLSVMGIVGSCVNIILFTRPRYRRAPCTLFILIGTFSDLFLLCFALLMYRVLNQIVDYDVVAFNHFICKVRLYLVDTALPLPIWCICLSTFNRYCITSRNAIRRQWCTAKRCQIMVAILVFASAGYRIPDLYYATILSAGSRLVCAVSVSNAAYLNLHYYFTFPVLATTAPLIVLLILTILTRANIRLFTAQQTASRIEQQLTSMILLQALGAACLVPFTINMFYLTITKFASKSEYQIAVENLITQIVTLGFYAHYASSFYIYLIASPDIRRSVQSVWYRIRGKLDTANQIAPMSTRTTPARQLNTLS